MSGSFEKKRGGPRVLVLVTASVAAIKTGDLVNSLLAHGASTVTVVASERAMHFVRRSDTPLADLSESVLDDASTNNLTGDSSSSSSSDHSADHTPIDGADRGVRVSVFTDSDEWALWDGRGDPVLHIDLRREADVAVVAPASANTLAKAALGIADGIVTCVLRCWQPLPPPERVCDNAKGSRVRWGRIASWVFSTSRNTSPHSSPLPRKPVIVCPAMNTAMWDHPITAEHLGTLRRYGYDVIDPIAKTLACGDIGVGAMAAVDDIAKRTVHLGKMYLENRDGQDPTRAAPEQHAGISPLGNAIDAAITCFGVAGIAAIGLLVARFRRLQ